VPDSEKKPVIFIGGRSNEELNRIHDFTNKIFRKQIRGYYVVEDYEAEENYRTEYTYVVAIRCDDERKAFELSLLFKPVDRSELVFYKPLR